MSRSSLRRLWQLARLVRVLAWAHTYSETWLHILQRRTSFIPAQPSYGIGPVCMNMISACTSPVLFGTLDTVGQATGGAVSSGHAPAPDCLLRPLLERKGLRSLLPKTLFWNVWQACTPPRWCCRMCASRCCRWRIPPRRRRRRSRSLRPARRGRWPSRRPSAACPRGWSARCAPWRRCSSCRWRASAVRHPMHSLARPANMKQS